MMSENIVSLDAWKGRLASSSKGYRKTISNLMMFLKHLPEFGGNIRWNELAYRPEWNGDPIEDSDLVQIRLILEKHEYEPSVGDVLPAVIKHAKDNPFHPVRDYLHSLKWDGKERLDTWMTKCMGAPDTLFTRLAGRRTLIAAVARAMKPGCKVDTVLVLEGPQGIKKSTAIATLFGEDYTAESVNLFDQHNKMVMAMMGAWCVELAEFIAITRRDENTVKGLLSMKSDRVVLPYAKMASDHPRQCVFFGTINPHESGYLTDATGNRRYWPVEVTKADIKAIGRFREQLWAEATKAYRDGERWWFEGEEEDTLANAQTRGRERSDPWDDILEEKLREYETVSPTAALQLIGMPNDRMDQRARDRITSSLRRLGFKSIPRKVRGENGQRESIRVYRRANE